MNVNPLMTVWLISCFISYSGLTSANRYSSFRHEKKKHGASELARLYGKEDSLASYKLNAFRLLTIDKKKKNKTSTTKPTTEVSNFDACLDSPSSTSPSTTSVKNKKVKTTKQAAENKDSCLGSLSSPSSTTNKCKKGTKKNKKHSRTSSQQVIDGGDNKNSNGNDNNIVNTGGGNKWKKIQKFFFGPPSWPFNKSYRAYAPTTIEAKYKEELRPMQLHQQPKEIIYDQTTIRDSTYFHQIQNIVNDQYKDKLSVKEEIIKKNMPSEENMNSKVQIDDVDMSNNASKHQPKEIEKIPPQKFYGDVVSKEPTKVEGMLLFRKQEDGNNRIPSVILMDKTDERTPPMQLDQQEAELSVSWFLKQEITTRQGLLESNKMSITEEGRLPPQDIPFEPMKEQTGMEGNDHTIGVIYNDENIPSNNQPESIENINYSNKEMHTDLFQTANTIDINEAIDERQLQLKPEEITDNIKEKYEASMVREDPTLSFKPEATIQLDCPPNQTSMENPDSSYERNQGITADKRKNSFNFNHPDYEQLKNIYTNLIIHHVTENDLITSGIENTLDKIVKPNINSISNLDYKSNMNDSSDIFFKLFSNYIKKGIPEIFPHYSFEKLFKTSLSPIYVFDTNNAYGQKAKQYFFLNTETKLPPEQINDNSHRNDVQVNEEKYSTLNLDTTWFGKSPSDHLQIMEPKLVLKNDSAIQQNLEGSANTTTASTIVQYGIDVWPKYTLKGGNNVDYFNNVNAESSNDFSSPTPLLEVPPSSNYQNELTPTEVADSSTTETSKGYLTSYEPTELPKATETFETLITIPIIITEEDSEMKTCSTVTQVTTAKHTGHQSVLNLTLHPMLFNNLWGIQSYLSGSVTTPSSTTFNVFIDDNIAFDNQHEFNSDHHFQSTSQPFFSDSSISKFEPLDIPISENKFDIISSSTLNINEMTQENAKQIKDFTVINNSVTGILKKSDMSTTEKNEKKKSISMPKYIPFSNRSNLFLNHPFEKSESVKEMEKYTSHQKYLVNDPIWNEIMYQTRLRKKKIGSLNKDLSISGTLLDGNQMFQNPRKSSFFEEKEGGDNLITYPLLEGTVMNNGEENVADLLVEPFLRNLKKMELLAPKMDDRNFDKIEAIKNGIDEIETQIMRRKNLRSRNKSNFLSNLNVPSSAETEEFKELTNKYEQANVELDDGFNQITTSWSLLEFKRKNVGKVNGNKADSLSNHNNEMLTTQPSVDLLNDNKPVTSSNVWSVRNEQNEKLLASEKSFDRQLSTSSLAAISSKKETDLYYPKNNISFLKNTLNQSLPGVTNNSDINKNEFSAIQMSEIKIIKTKPDIFLSPYDQLRNIFNQNNNNTEINREMSQIFMKMQDFANKFGMKKILLKRGIKELQSNPFDSYDSWRNKCSVLPTYNAEVIPFVANLMLNNSKISPSNFISDKKIGNIISNGADNKIIDKWKSSMQTVIDKQNEKRNLNLNIYDSDIQKDRSLLNVMNNDVQNSAIQDNSLEKYLGNQIPLINSDDNYEHSDEQPFTNNSKTVERNVVGNKKMKSRELEFILNRNLPNLPLNKRLFITYMMTGLKNSGNPIVLDDERHSQLSKANLQNLIDRNVKKDKMVELTNERPRKKQWQTGGFP